MSQHYKVSQVGKFLEIRQMVPHLTYLDRVMRSRAYQDIYQVFTKAHSPAKEITESCGALNALKPFLKSYNRPARVLHVGDGSMCRTSVIFSFFTKNTINVSIDPLVNKEAMDSWISATSARNLSYVGMKLEDAITQGVINLQDFDFFTFVHSHVNTDWVLTQSSTWTAAFVLGCCRPGTQSSAAKNLDYVEDFGILSSKRTYQIIQSKYLDDKDWNLMRDHAKKSPSSFT